jgi:hypothetical protein
VSKTRFGIDCHWSAFSETISCAVRTLGDTTDDKAGFGLFSRDGGQGQLRSLRIGSDKPDSRSGVSL